MKLVFILGDAAVGKMTVGQELMKITDLRLFHNHMTIEPVLEIMGRFDGQLINDMRELIFRRFAASDNYGMIFTIMMAFDMQSDWDYLEHVKSIFVPYGTEFYYVELIAPENRLQHKPSKRDIEVSDRRLLRDDENHRCVSYPGEVPFENYLRIENTDLPAATVAQMIKDRFSL